MLITIALSSASCMSSPAKDSGGSTGSTSSASTNWNLVFEDDFNGTALNSAYWTALDRGLSFNNENQAYTNSAVSVENGSLVITSKQEHWVGLSRRVDNMNSIVTQEYTSGQVESKGKKSWTYGKFECRAKVSLTKGMLSAIWMSTESGNWPPEIDIAEVLGNEPSKLYMTSHYGTPSSHGMNSGNFPGTEDLSQDFHVYGLVWEPGKIEWYLDGTKRYETTVSVPSEPFFFILCPAIGPDWTGDPDGSSTFPQRFEIDWVRVYQK